MPLLKVPCPQCGNPKSILSKLCNACANPRKYSGTTKEERKYQAVKEWRKNNPEESKKHADKYVKEHREKVIEYRKKYQKENREQINNKLEQKRRANPKHHLKIQMDYYTRHRDERIEKMREYRTNNPEKMREQVLKYYRSEKGKAYFMKARKRHQDTPQLLKNKYILLWIECRPCEQCGTFSEREVDHIVEQSKGGSDNLDNLRVLCFTHHRKAGIGRHSTWREGK